MEWHAFVTIPEPTRNEFSLIVSRAGDRTANVIQNPPASWRARPGQAYSQDGQGVLRRGRRCRFNRHLTEKLVHGLTFRGIPAYGAIFDS